MSPKNWEDVPNFRKRVILLDKNAWRGLCVFYGLFEWKKSTGHVLCKMVSHTTVEPPLFPGALYLLSNFIGKDSVRAKSQIRFFTSLAGVQTGRKNKRDIFYPARTSVLIKSLSKLDI